MLIHLECGCNSRDFLAMLLADSGQLPRQVGETLGEGASGDVFLSTFKDTPVAVKVFKTEVCMNHLTPCKIAGNGDNHRDPRIIFQLMLRVRLLPSADVF